MRFSLKKILIYSSLLFFGLTAPYVSLAKKNGEVVVAVIDDGVYLNHEALRSRMWVNKNEILGNSKDDDKNGYTDDVYGYNFVFKNGDMATTGPHGTAVAGIISAQNNGTEISGIAPESTIMPLIVTNEQGVSYTKDVISAIHYAVDNGADVLNISLGNANGSAAYTTAYDSAIAYAYAHNAVIVAAAGNEDEESKTYGQNLNFLPASPVCNEKGENMILGVGAINSSTGEYETWSAFGSNCVDIYAPGTNILTASVPKYTGSYYARAEGTSFSAPMVSATAALIKAGDSSLSNAEIIKRILGSGDSLIVRGEHARTLNIQNAIGNTTVVPHAVAINSVEPVRVAAGAKIAVRGAGFTSQTEFRLFNDTQESVINFYDIRLEGQSKAHFIIPPYLNSGDYAIEALNIDAMSAPFENALFVKKKKHDFFSIARYFQK
ncbi:MAG: Peptidase S8 and S53, subtilisin, kexin, sedolisin:Integrins alpha chain [Parcubacteria group bacterium GW2011_GWA2_44_12]|nr:MAG: Peptidase S8 and S53, subtilisin, kexin, sedolisin:Integrins alpha chain [Parcubacteria group bacterium GW2011_GWA2_44_12]